MLVKINGEALEVIVDAPGTSLAEATEAAYRLHGRVCARIRRIERAEERRQSESTDLGAASAGQIIQMSHQGNPYGFAWVSSGERIEVDR